MRRNVGARMSGRDATGRMGSDGHGDRVTESAMSVQITLQGTVKADGSLELDDPVAMPEGRVLVTVRPIVQPDPNDPFWQRMEQIWAGQRARGQVRVIKSRSMRSYESFGTMPRSRCRRRAALRGMPANP